MENLEPFVGDRLYFDANIFIYIAEGFPGYESLLRQLLTMVEERAITAITSQLTLAEVLVKPLQKDAREIVKLYETMLAEIL